MKSILAVAGFVALAGCSAHVQTTSGSDYLAEYQADYEAQTGRSATAAPLDPAIVRAASVEPLLTFPARIGIARVHYGDLVTLSPDEAQIWGAAAKTLGPDYGEFVPISPLVAELARQVACTAGSCIRGAVEQIRIAAARQHLDAVLVYEAGTSVDRYDNPLWLTHFTIIGMFIAPSEHADVDGAGQAMLLDVRNGYVYGFANAVVDDAVEAVTTRDRISERVESAEREADIATVAALAEKSVELAREVRSALQDERAKAEPETGS